MGRRACLRARLATPCVFAPAQVRGIVAEPTFRWGFSYRTVLYTLEPLDHHESRAPLRIGRYSRELSFPALDSAAAGRGAPAYAESIQFVMGAVVDGDRLTLTYGVNDCESAAVTLTMGALQRLLEFPRDDRRASRHGRPSKSA